MKNDVIFSLANLSISYDNVVFDNVSLAIKSHQVTLIQGGNGTGKTTLCRMLTGLENRYEGKIAIYDNDLSCLKPHTLNKYILYLKQEPENNVVAATADEDLSIWQHCFILKDTDEILRRQALAKFRIEEIKDKPCWELSTGQIKRIGLAALTMFEDKYWILDEPTAALDSGHIANLCQIIEQRKNKGLGTMIMTHRPFRFQAIADLSLTIQKGKLL